MGRSHVFVRYVLNFFFCFKVYSRSLNDIRFENQEEIDINEFDEITKLIALKSTNNYCYMHVSTTTHAHTHSTQYAIPIHNTHINTILRYFTKTIGNSSSNTGRLRHMTTYYNVIIIKKKKIHLTFFLSLFCCFFGRRQVCLRDIFIIELFIRILFKCLCGAKRVYSVLKIKQNKQFCTLIQVRCIR